MRIEYIICFIGRIFFICKLEVVYFVYYNYYFGIKIIDDNV